MMSERSSLRDDLQRVLIERTVCRGDALAVLQGVDIRLTSALRFGRESPTLLGVHNISIIGRVLSTI